MPASRLIVSLTAGAAATLVLAPTLAQAQAQWWRGAPKDFEECADIAEKAKTKEEKTSALGECNAKFAGRRKPGGGYTYYDFLQDRSFDIAGPNPTPDEQRKIDQQYTAYLARPRHDRIANAFAAERQHRQEPIQQASLQAESEKNPAPVANRVKPRPAPPAAEVRPPVRPAAGCTKGSFSCDWPRLSAGIGDLKKLFTPPPPPAKPKRS